MKIVAHSKRCSLARPRAPKKSFQITVTERGGFILAPYEPIDQETTHAESYELSNNLKTGSNLGPVPPLDLLSFQDKLLSMETRLSDLSSRIQAAQIPDPSPVSDPFLVSDLS